MYVQGVDRVYDLNFNGREGAEKVTYGDVSCRPSRNIRGTISSTPTPTCCSGNFRWPKKPAENTWTRGWKDGKREAHLMALPAYDQCIKASHVFNLLDARGVISVTERQSYIMRCARTGESLRRSLGAHRSGGAI